jgi:ABC-2 type transport system permease protein
MLGKIIGVGMVGLTQFVLWIVLSVTLSTVGVSFIQGKMKAKTEMGTTAKHSLAVQKATAVSDGAAISDDDTFSLMSSLQSLPLALIICTFLFYFIFGFFLYSAIFAAVGSAVDNETETQQFMIPVTMPLIFTYALSMSVIVPHPDSPLSVWLSMIPFTSPIAMMVRIPFGVPVWQLALSMVLMVLGFMFTTWVAGRIYRVGILMYGKKASYKELAKWFMYKE